MCGLHAFSSGHAGREREERFGVGLTLEDRMLIGDGARRIGLVRIDDDATIRANAVIAKDIPNGATVLDFNKVTKEEPNG